MIPVVESSHNLRLVETPPGLWALTNKENPNNIIHLNVNNNFFWVELSKSQKFRVIYLKVFSVESIHKKSF